ncbi:hypothetical protein CRG98_043791 [Punica granatum]|uniref:Uncharacterized protein n=1 Tax=Punica granatum TaxID=22663 RepID=A0A2I0HWD1_PUNGR|nr:hypothetical protein CRG98_043791 [Punica granatum]
MATIARRDPATTGHQGAAGSSSLQLLIGDDAEKIFGLLLPTSAVVSYLQEGLSGDPRAPSDAQTRSMIEVSV